MNILQINKFYYQRGGSERYLFNLSKELEKRGHNVVPFSMHDEKNWASDYSMYFIDPVDLHKFNVKNIFKFFYNYDAIRKLKKLLSTQKFDIAHLHNIAHQLSPAIIKVLKDKNIPIVQTLHDYKLICPNSLVYSQNKICTSCKGAKYYNCFTKKCIHNSRSMSFLGMIEAYLNNRILKYYEKVDLFIAPSQYMKDICVSFGIPKEKIVVLYNFIDGSTNQVDSGKGDYFLYFGRLSEEKGIDTILEAARIIGDKCFVKIVGTGPYFTSLKQKSKDLKIENQVEIVGPKYGEELDIIIRNSLAVILPSKWPENMPYSLLESLVKEKNVIISKIGGMQEVIKDNENGLLFEAGNSNDLAEKMKIIINNQYKFNYEVNKFILGNLSAEKHLSLLEKYYLSIKK